MEWEISGINIEDKPIVGSVESMWIFNYSHFLSRYASYDDEDENGDSAGSILPLLETNTNATANKNNYEVKTWL